MKIEYHILNEDITPVVKYIANLLCEIEVDKEGNSIIHKKTEVLVRYDGNGGVKFLRTIFRPLSSNSDLVKKIETYWVEKNIAPAFALTTP